jgi:hypothetical protein
MIYPKSMHVYMRPHAAIVPHSSNPIPPLLQLSLYVVSDKLLVLCFRNVLHVANLLPARHGTVPTHGRHPNPHVAQLLPFNIPTQQRSAVQRAPTQKYGKLTPTIYNSVTFVHLKTTYCTQNHLLRLQKNNIEGGGSYFFCS